MGDIDKKNVFDDAVVKEVEDRLEKKELNDTLKLIANASSIYPDIISHLSELRQSVEVLTRSINVLDENHNSHFNKTDETIEDLNSVFNKVREVTEHIIELEDKIVNKNNPNSIVEVFSLMSNDQTDVIMNAIAKQGRSLTDQNNSASIISVLKKSLSIQSTVTWIMLSVISILTILDKIGIFNK